MAAWCSSMCSRTQYPGAMTPHWPGNREYVFPPTSVTLPVPSEIGPACFAQLASGCTNPPSVGSKERNKMRKRKQGVVEEAIKLVLELYFPCFGAKYTHTAGSKVEVPKRIPTVFAY